MARRSRGNIFEIQKKKNAQKYFFFLQDTLALCRQGTSAYERCGLWWPGMRHTPRPQRPTIGRQCPPPASRSPGGCSWFFFLFCNNKNSKKKDLWGSFFWLLQSGLTSEYRFQTNQTFNACKRSHRRTARAYTQAHSPSRTAATSTAPSLQFNAPTGAAQGR